MSRAIPVRPKDWMCFQCRRCAGCCRDLEGQLMLEPLDAYRLARCLREQGEAGSIHDVYERYAHTDLLEGRLTIYLMNTVGNDHACVLLKDGRCSAYEGRPSVCRIYPPSVRPGQRGKPFEYYRCVDQHAAHFSDGKLQVKDWLHENFSRESREFWAAEGSAPYFFRIVRPQNNALIIGRNRIRTRAVYRSGLATGNNIEPPTLS